MRRLPTDVFAYKRTATFTEDTVPAGLLRRHRTKPGTWARIVVEQGELLYRILEPELEEVRLSSDRVGIVEPGVFHEVAPRGEVRFYVEFLSKLGGCRETSPP